MEYEQGKILLSNAVKGFHGRFKKLYGQMALRLDEETCIVTSANMQLSAITEEHFMLCDINNGDLGEIFRRCPGVNAIIFGCSADAVAVSERSEPLTSALEDLAQLTGSSLRIINDLKPESVAGAFRQSGVALVRGMGIICGASNMKKAVAGIQIAEKACEAEIHGELLGGTVPLDPALSERLMRSFRQDYVNRNQEPHVQFVGFDEAEFALRSALIEYGKEMVRRDLSYGSWGNLSVRLNDHEMLITPSSMDYFEIRPEDIVRLDLQDLDYGEQRIPSSACGLHAELYQRFPDCGAIIQSTSNGMSVFAACEAGFGLGPEMQQLIGDVLVTEYAYPGTPELAAAAAETLASTHACVIPHHGAVFTGPSLEVVFMIAEAVEQRARSLLGFDSTPE